MKDWMKELILGLILLVVGGILTASFIGDVIRVILGAIGPLFLFLGIVFAWIGYEDKKLEKELIELEKELEKEITNEDKDVEDNKPEKKEDNTKEKKKEAKKKRGRRKKSSKTE